MGKLRNYAKNSMISLLIKEGFKVMLMISKPNYYCRVCGLIQDDSPWGNDNQHFLKKNLDPFYSKLIE